MKVNKVLSFAICLLLFGVMMPVRSYANAGGDDNKKKEKKEKTKKAKKPYVWVMPKLTGDKAMDDYLLLCDTMNTQIKKYCDDIVFYEIAKIEVTKENGETYEKYGMVDSLGNLRSSNAALSQNLDIIFAYPDLVLDATNLTLATTTATTALASNPLLALSHGKYLKAGPVLTGRAFKEMKVIYKKARAQAKLIKALKAGQTDNLEALNAEVHAGEMEAGAASLKTYKKVEGDYLKQCEEVTAVDEEYAESAARQEPPEEEI